MQLSIPKTGEAPISISGIGDGYMDFTLRAVGKVTNEIFEKQVGDYLYLRGPYGNGWPCEKLEGKHLIFYYRRNRTCPCEVFVKQILQ